MMEFRFDSNQPFQLGAIEAVADLFEGQPFIVPGLRFVPRTGFAAVANHLNLGEPRLLENLQAVQSRNEIPPDKQLAVIEENIDTNEGIRTVRFPNFSVEMETGTGKTYVYLRTILELFRRYGLRKYLIIVPSVAIREGVLKTLKITERHLRELHENPPYRYCVYDSAKLSQVRQFTLSDGIEIMLMTIDAFNKAANVIRQGTDRLQGETPIHLIQAARPILVIDEPQNMESEKSISALSGLCPLVALRYSATHRNPYCVVYRLTPFDAYRQGLVKRIEVAGILRQDQFNQAFVRLDSVTTKKNTVTARVTIQKLLRSGTIKEQAVTVRPGDSLRHKAGLPKYEGFDIQEISPGTDSVLFANGVEIRRGEMRGGDKEALFRAQTGYTIEEHFRKQARLRPMGIKVLSLFFIDRVSNYAAEDGIIRRLFTEEFDRVKTRYSEWRDVPSSKVHAAYFAQRHARDGTVVFEDSTTGTTARDEEVYNLIMKDKERLLSFEEPVSFIFSHSALREGWDSPNVFQICTLNQTVSEIKKRQEVGRGMRLAVDQSGNRIHDERVNVLTVVANESYESYVQRLQSEIEEEYGSREAVPVPANARQRGVARLRGQPALNPDFCALWERIKHRTRYMVTVDTAKLIEAVAIELKRTTIATPHITATKARVEVGQEDTLQGIQVGAQRLDYSTHCPLPNLIEVMEHLLRYTSPSVCLTRKTLLAIVTRVADKAVMVANPYGFAVTVSQIIKSKLADYLIGGIQYQKTGESFEMTLFEPEVESWQEYLVPATRSVYDYVICDSCLEKTFVRGMERRDDIRIFIKLPRWFTIPTPVGDYNPDWAIVMESRDPHGDSNRHQVLCLIRETKSTTDLAQLRPDEARKCEYGEKHFKEALGLDYRVIANAGDLP